MHPHPPRPRVEPGERKESNVVSKVKRENRPVSPFFGMYGGGAQLAHFPRCVMAADRETRSSVHTPLKQDGLLECSSTALLFTTEYQAILRKLNEL